MTVVRCWFSRKFRLIRALEIAFSRGEPRLYRGERRGEGERGERIAIVQPGLERAQHQTDAARKGTGIVLAQAELDGIDGGFHGQPVDAARGKVAEHGEDQRLDLVGVRGLDALQTDRVGRLAKGGGQPGTGQRFAEPGVDERLVQRRSRRSGQDVVEDAEGQIGLDVDDLAEHPVDHDQGFPGGIFVFRSDIGPGQAARFREAWLQGDRRVPPPPPRTG